MSWRLRLAAVAAVLAASPVQAGTVAHWRFENGTAGTPVPHSTPDGQFDGTTPDVSGNGNHLSVWNVGGAGYDYRSSVPYSTIPSLGNAANTLSVRNSGGGPAMFTNSAVSLPGGVNLETMTPAAFTIEASYKPENGGHRTVVGRDARNIGGDPKAAALYLQIRPDNSVGIQFTDVAGSTWQAFSAPGYIQGYNFGTDPEGLTGTWYRLAAVSDGSTLKMYVDNNLVATTAIASANTALAVGTSNFGAGDWHVGEWSVGRGLYDGGHGDRAFGFIDEVRISNSALAPSQFLSSPVPEPATAGMALVGLIGLAMGRRRSK